MMKILLIALLSFINWMSYSQSKDLIDAQDYYRAYVKEGREPDIIRAFELVEKSKSTEENRKNDDANFLVAVITKQYYEVKKSAKGHLLVQQVSKSLLKSYELNKNSRNKENILKLMQIIGYDLYSQGIQLYKSGNNELAYDLYRDIVKIQDILRENDLDFTLISQSGEKSNLFNKDIMNNLAVFAMNSGKNKEAKSIFESDVKRHPTALGYSKLIQICNQIGDREAARNYVKEAINKFPNDADLIVYSINMNLDNNDLGRALIQIDKAISIEPSVKLFLVKSQTLEKKEMYLESIENYKRALDIYSDDFDLNYGLGLALFNSSILTLNIRSDESIRIAKNKIESAKKYFKKAEKINPTKIDFNKLYEQVHSIKY